MSDEEVCRYCSRFEKRLPLSKERRKFIIVASFDSVFITSLWILCTVKKGGDDWRQDFLAEVNLFDPYSLERSLFDLALLANLRVAFLLFFYVALRCQHWVPVAFCTTGSTLYTVAKIFLFFGQRRNRLSTITVDEFRHGRHDGMPHYFLIIASLFVAWFELWLMPFRVLSAERESYAYRRHHSSPSANSVESGERLKAPRPSFAHPPKCAVGLTSSLSTSQIYQSNENYRTHNISEDEFHSALEYSSSDDELPESKENGGPFNTRIGQILRNKSIQLAAEARLKAKGLLAEAPTWKVIHAKMPTIRIDNASNTYYVNAEFCYPPKRVFEAIWWKTQSWNHNVREFRVLNKIDARTDVVLSTTVPALGGYVAQRHFVDVRTYDYDSITDRFFGVYTSVEANGRTSTGNEIWGKNGVNAMRVELITNDASTSQKAVVSDLPLPPSTTLTKFEWLMNTDMQGTIPRVLMRRTMGTFLCDYVHSLEQFLRNGNDSLPCAIR